MKNFLKVICVCMLLISCSKQEEKTKMIVDQIVVTTNTGDVTYDVEIAKTSKEQKTGLMHRETMPTNAGMLFELENVRPVTMWMKNTIISLDFLFIDASGTVIQVFENAEPMSEKHIVCEKPAKAVLEINAGQIAKNSIKVGDKVNHQIFDSLTK